MTQYQSGASFRRALEDRLRTRSLDSDVPLARLRKMVAFDRFLARLVQEQPDIWILKGGFAIQIRLMDKSRTTKDIDLLARTNMRDVLNLLRLAAAVDLQDWFYFEIAEGEDREREVFGGLRFHIRSLLDGRRFEEFHLDVGIGDPIIGPIDRLEGPGLLEFAGIQPTTIPCYPIAQQIAEKLHAYTRPHVSGESSRVKDFVDILILAELENIDAVRLTKAIHATFATRKTHSIPKEIPDPPPEWSRSFQKLAAEVSLRFQALDEANTAIKGFLNPVVSGEVIHHWNPKRWSWD